MSTGSRTSTPFPFDRDAELREAGRCTVVVAPPLDVLGFFAAEAEEPRVREDLAAEDLAAGLLERDAFEPLAADVLELDVVDFFALDGLEREAPLLALADAFRADALTLVADLPASAMPAHPPVNVPERVALSGSRCFRLGQAASAA